MKEEDIELLERLIEEGFSAMCPLEAQAIENLIKGYRELEKHISFYEKNGSYKKRIIELKEENEELKEQVEYLKHEVVLHGSTVEKLVREKMNSIPNSKIKEIKTENEKRIDKLRPYKHQAPFDFGVLNGIDECCRKLLEDK